MRNSRPASDAPRPPVAALALGLGLIGAAAVAVTPLPPTTPALSAASVNSVTSFASNHPEFGPLRDGRKDATGIKFPHDKHLNRKDAVNAKEWKGVDRALECLDCHEPESDGLLMKPVTFENHCAACHASQLGKIDIAEGVLPEVVPPHAETKVIAAAIDAQAKAWIAAASARPAPAAPAAGGDGAKPEEPKAPSRGRRTQAAAEPKKATLPTIDSPEKLTAFLASQREGVFKDLVKGTRCNYCHEVEKPASLADGFGVVNPHVPDRWMPKSVFSHEAHTMIDCRACHSAEKSGSASDINLPGIESCRECHSPEGGSVHSCVSCHVYHQPRATPAAGNLKPGDLLAK